MIGTIGQSSMTSEELTLDQVRPGAVASVLRVEGDDAVARRLGDLGFWAGTSVEVVRRAPLGDPTQYDLRGYRLALRRSEARRVVVTSSGDAGPREAA